MKKIIAFILFVLMIICSFNISAFAYEPEGNPDEYGFFDLGTTKMEYAVYGKEHSQALVVLPGNRGDIHEFEYNVIPRMSRYYKVIAFSPRGTGETKLGTTRLTFETEADDIAKLLDYLGVEKTYVYGFSDGANLGLVFTLRYPDRVTKLCIQSPNINIFGTKLKDQLVIIYHYILYSVEYAFTKDPEILCKRELKGMMAYQPVLRFKDLEKIEIPVLHLYAENDMMYRSHCERIGKHIPNCKSILMTGVDHTGAFINPDGFLIPEMTEFFG